MQVELESDCGLLRVQCARDIVLGEKAAGNPCRKGKLGAELYCPFRALGGTEDTSSSHRGARAGGKVAAPPATCPDARAPYHALPTPDSGRWRTASVTFVHVRAHEVSCAGSHALMPAAIASCRAPRGGAPSALPATCPDNRVTLDT